MDYQEAIKVLHYATLSGGHPKDLCDMKAVATLAMQELQEYKKLGTLEEVREAVEKQKAKKPVVGAEAMVGRDDGGNPIWETDYVCAECGMGIAPEYVCCPYCETVIDWSEEI